MKHNPDKLNYLFGGALDSAKLETIVSLHVTRVRTTAPRLRLSSAEQLQYSSGLSSERSNMGLRAEIAKLKKDTLFEREETTFETGVMMSPNEESGRLERCANSEIKGAKAYTVITNEKIGFQVLIPDNGRGS
jgi:hypothetical protein